MNLLSELAASAAGGSDVVLGVRPEDLRVLPAGTPGALVDGEVFTVELTGDSTYVTLKAGEQLVTAKESKHFRAEVGQRLAFGAEPARCHRFDAKTGLRLPLMSPLHLPPCPPEHTA
ncbi:MAG: TOBE domain-containing protein [Rubrivivax sp.]|nr:TOBE domain-containing protein [Rubrivivax sp.]